MWRGAVEVGVVTNVDEEAGVGDLELEEGVGYLVGC